MTASTQTAIKKLPMLRRWPALALTSTTAFVSAGDAIDFNNLLQAAPKLKDDPAVFGYFVSDRCCSTAVPSFAATARKFETADPKEGHLQMVNCRA